jgi:hypothetical protein
MWYGSKDGVVQTLFWKNLNSVISDNGMSKVNFKGFMADIAHANWNAVRKIYGKVTQVCQWWVISVFVFSIDHKVWIRWRRSISRHLYSFNTNNYAKIIKTRKQLMKLKLNIMSFVHGGCHLKLPWKKSFSSCPSGWGFGTFVIGNGVVT